MRLANTFRLPNGSIKGATVRRAGAKRADACPPNSDMRADPRFLPLMQKLGYVDCWKQTRTNPDICDMDERDIPLCRALQ